MTLVRGWPASAADGFRRNWRDTALLVRLNNVLEKPASPTSVSAGSRLVMSRHPVSPSTHVHPVAPVPLVFIHLRAPLVPSLSRYSTPIRSMRWRAGPYCRVWQQWVHASSITRARQPAEDSGADANRAQSSIRQWKRRPDHARRGRGPRLETPLPARR